MGLYVLIKDQDFNDHPDWDFGLAGDKQFPSWMGDHSDIVYFGEGDSEFELFRPLDIEAWRERLPPDRPNFSRFLELFDILESDECKWWIYYSW